MVTQEDVWGVVSLDGEEWKKVPLYRDTYASSKGRIAKNFRGKGYRLARQFKDATYKDHYMATSVRDMDGRYLTVQVHVLVALAFHGIPEDFGSVYVTVNHKDGDKVNNEKDNLEWNTRSENLIHAYMTGLRTENVRVVVEDIHTGAVKEYYSISEFARKFGVTKSKANTLLRRHHCKDKAYEGQYVFTMDLENKVTNKHPWVRDIVGVDYRNNKLHVCTDSALMERISGVNRATILYSLRGKKYNLINGFVFKYKDDPTEWPKYTKEEAIESFNRYTTREPHAEKRFGVTVMDYTTGETRSYSTCGECDQKEGLFKGSTQNLLRNNPGKLYRGIAVRYQDDTTPFREITKEELEASLRYSKTLKTVYKCIDLELNTTEFYPTIHEFAVSRNLNGASLATNVRDGNPTPFKGRYIVTLHSTCD